MRIWPLVFFAAALVATAQPAAPSKAEAAAERRLERDVAHFASPGLKGRGNGYPELEQAAKHVQRQWKALGLKTQVQHFPFVARIVREQGEALLVKGDAPRPLVWGKDIEAIGLSSDASFQTKALAFLGYGLQVPGGYDDFAGMDLKGRVAVIARTVPDLEAFARLPRGERSLMVRLKRLEALKVAGVIVLEDRGLRPLQREEGPVKMDLPVVGMTAQALSEACGDLEARLKAIKDTGKPASQDFIQAPWTALSLTLKLRREEAQVPNVVAVLPGRDPKLRKEFVVLGAHLDHLGLGERHSGGGAQTMGQVHPGADDNASGSAMVLELGRELMKARPRRSVLLMHFGGEEEGLLGSQHWIRNPTHPLESVKFMLNFDMVGRLDPKSPKIMLGGLGAPKGALEAAQKFVPAGFTVGIDVGAGVGGSDHMAFSQAKIPTFFFFTGPHSDYHRPTDTADRINFAGMAKLAGFAKTVALDLANAESLPAWDAETAKIPSRPEGGGARISFGTIPDFADHPKGFRINGVTKGSTAEAVGMQAGDVIVRFGEKPIKNFYDYNAALSAYKAGDRVEVQWLRGDQPMKAEATLKGR